MTAAAGSDLPVVATVAVFVFGVLFTVIGWLIARAIRATDEALRELGGAVKDNTRHLSALAASSMVTQMRMTTLEDWAADRFDYAPPRVFPEWPFDAGNTRG